MFKDITPLLASPRALHVVLDGIAERFIGEHVDAIVGIEARGFIFGGALAARLNASFVPVRKPGKLPASVDRVEHVTEYSKDALEMHKGSIREGAHVVVVDDVLATGGTALGAAELVRKQGGYVVGYAVRRRARVPRRPREAAAGARGELHRVLVDYSASQSRDEVGVRWRQREETGQAGARPLARGGRAGAASALPFTGLPLAAACPRRLAAAFRLPAGASHQVTGLPRAMRRKATAPAARGGSRRSSRKNAPMRATRPAVPLRTTAIARATAVRGGRVRVPPQRSRAALLQIEQHEARTRVSASSASGGTP